MFVVGIGTGRTGTSTRDETPVTKLGETHPNERCSITVDQVFIKSDRLVGHRCAKPSGSLVPVIAWLDACDVSTQGWGRLVVGRRGSVRRRSPIVGDDDKIHRQNPVAALRRQQLTQTECLTGQRNVVPSDSDSLLRTARLAKLERRNGDSQQQSTDRRTRT